MATKSKLLEKGRYYIFEQQGTKTTTVRQELKPTKGKARFVTLASYPTKRGE